MARKNSNTGLSLLTGLLFLSPVTYSILAYEMDVVQRMFFFSASLLLFLVFILKFKVDKPIPFNKILFILIILFPFTFLTAFVNDSSSLLILKLSDIIIPFSILIQSAILFLMLGEEKFLKVVSFSVVIISTLFSIIGLFELMQIKILPLPTVIAPGSVLGHRGFAAEYLLSTIPFLLVANEYTKKDKRYFLLIASIINVSFLLFTRSRAGIIILLVAALIFFIFVLTKKQKGERFSALKPVLIVLAVSFLISLIPVKVGERPDLKSTAASFFDEEFRSNLLRLNFWEASVQMIKEKPFTGKGLYKWSGYYPAYFGADFTDKNLFYVHNIHAHNDFLEVFAESGLVAFLVFFLIYVTIALSLFNRSRKNPKYFPLLLAFIITFAFSFVSFPNHKFASYFLAAVITGVVLIGEQGKELRSINFKFSYLKWTLFCLIIIGGIVSYIKLKSEISYGQAIYLKEQRQYAFMLQKLQEVSVIFYPLDSSRQPVDYYRGIANSYLGRYSEALSNNISGQSLAPFNPILLRNIAASYQALGKAESAIEQLEKLHGMFPNYLNAQFHLLGLYIETGQTSKANELLSELVRKSPDNPRLPEFRKKLQVE